MTTWLPRWFACLVLVFSFVPVVAAASDDAEIARLVKQLGHDDFDKREDATISRLASPDAKAQGLTEDGEPVTGLDHFRQFRKAFFSAFPDLRVTVEDVLLDGGKLAGILAELHGDRVIVGVGVNLTWAPPGAAMLGPDADRETLLETLLAELQRWFAAPEPAVLGAWRTRADTLGRTGIRHPH